MLVVVADKVLDRGQNALGLNAPDESRGSQTSLDSEKFNSLFTKEEYAVLSTYQERIFANGLEATAAQRRSLHVDGGT